MDKFLCSTKKPEAKSEPSAKSGQSLLSLMQGKASSVQSNGWSTLPKTITMTTISCNERTKRLNTDVKGWKQVGDEKTYTTFRNGKLVTASGAEGFKLACGDQRSSTKSKENVVNGIPESSGKRKAADDEVAGTATNSNKQSRKRSSAEVITLS